MTVLIVFLPLSGAEAALAQVVGLAPAPAVYLEPAPAGDRVAEFPLAWAIRRRVEAVRMDTVAVEAGTGSGLRAGPALGIWVEVQASVCIDHAMVCAAGAAQLS